MTSINFNSLDDVVAVLREGNAVITLVKGGRFQLLNLPLVVKEETEAGFILTKPRSRVPVMVLRTNTAHSVAEADTFTSGGDVFKIALS